LLETKFCDGTTPRLAQALIAAAATIAAPMVMVVIRIEKSNLTKDCENRCAAGFDGMSALPSAPQHALDERSLIKRR
jgi:hypothetical protein